MIFYSVLDVTPTEQTWVEPYVAVANRLITKHGGQYLARTVEHEQLEGRGEPVGMRIVIEWPSKQAAINFMNDPEYQPHLQARTTGSVSNHYLIAGKDELA